MDVKVEDVNGVAVVAVVGSIDSQTAPDLSTALGAQIASGKINLVADMSGVDYTSSAGLRALLGSLKDSRSRGGDFRLAGIQSGVMRVLEMSGFTTILKSYASVEQAVASFAG